MGNLHFDALAIGALVGFGSLLVIMAGITIWVVRKAYSTPSSGEGPDAQS
ncbi:MAG: hypothetical protein KDA53_06910 [Hyphomonas sp.]|nr:hypothetical protein [Hyphomonas sp.]